MKRILFVIVFILSAAFVSAQDGKFKGFFKPVPDDLVSQPLMYGGTVSNANTWLFRPAVQISAMQIFRNKETKTWESAQFSSAGIGLSYQHFIEANGVAVSNYGFTALLLFDASATKTTVSPAVTFNALQYVNFGAGYNTSFKQLFGLIGVQYSFY